MSCRAGDGDPEIAGALNDPDLAAVVQAWDRLPEAVRAGIVAMVRASARPTPKTPETLKASGTAPWRWSRPRPESMDFMREGNGKRGGSGPANSRAVHRISRRLIRRTERVLGII
jgi:hypothetical protein